MTSYNVEWHSLILVWEWCNWKLRRVKKLTCRVVDCRPTYFKFVVLCRSTSRRIISGGPSSSSAKGHLKFWLTDWLIDWLIIVSLSCSGCDRNTGRDISLICCDCMPGPAADSNMRRSLPDNNSSDVRSRSVAAGESQCGWTLRDAGHCGHLLVPLGFAVTLMWICVLWIVVRRRRPAVIADASSLCVCRSLGRQDALAWTASAYHRGDLFIPQVRWNGSYIGPHERRVFNKRASYR